jgi:hypothetical protein
LTGRKKVKDKAALLKKNQVLLYAEICNDLNEAFFGRGIGNVDHV